MKIGILGDLCLSYPDPKIFDKILEEYGNSTILKELLKNDFNIVNLEAPITNSDKQIKKTGPNLKNPNEVIDILKLTNIQICTIANNHIYDFGLDGLKDSIEICEKSNLRTTGAGFDLLKINKPLIIENNQVKVALITFAENEFNTIDLNSKGTGSNSLDLIDIYKQINFSKLNYDFTILIAHGGHEQYNYPSPRIKKLYRFLIDIGADAVIAHHPHVVQGYEEYKEKPIFYSIGNYFFPSIKKIKSNQEGFVVVLEFSVNKLLYKILPYNQCFDNFRVDLMEGEQKSEFLERLNSFSKKILNDDELNKEWQGMVKKREDYFFNSLFPFNKKITHRLVKYGLHKIFVPENYFLKLLNLVRCESHRDILVNILKEKSYGES